MYPTSLGFFLILLVEAFNPAIRWCFCLYSRVPCLYMICLYLSYYSPFLFSKSNHVVVDFMKVACTYDKLRQSVQRQQRASRMLLRFCIA